MAVARLVLLLLFLNSNSNGFSVTLTTRLEGPTLDPVATPFKLNLTSSIVSVLSLHWLMCTCPL